MKLPLSVAHINHNDNLQATQGIKSHWIAIILASLVAANFFSTFLTNLAAVLINITAVVHWYRYRQWYLLRSPLAICCISMLTWILVRDLAGGSGWVSAWREVNDFRPLIFIVLWAPLFINLTHRKIVAITFGICMAIFCIVVLIATVWTGKPAYVEFFSRAPDLSGPMLVTAIMASIQLAITLKKNKWLWWLGAIIGTTTLFFATDRRTGHLIFFICLAYLILMNTPKMNSNKILLTFRLLLIPALFSVFFFSFSNVRQGIQKVFDESNQFSQTIDIQQGLLQTSIGLRLRFWSISKKLIEESPLIGSGLSKFSERYAAYDSQLGGSKNIVKNPHNEYIYILASLGLTGLLFYLAIQTQIILFALRLVNTAQKQILLLAITSLLCSIFFNSMIIDMVPGHFYALTILCLGWFDWPNKI